MTDLGLIFFSNIMKPTSANPEKNPEGWKEIHESRIAELGKIIGEWESKEGRSEVESRAYLLYQEAKKLGKLISSYDNRRESESEIISPSTVRAATGEITPWKKNDGFMAGKPAYVDSSVPEEFWVFKSPGETRYAEAAEKNYVFEGGAATEENKIFNLDYSRGFLEVYSLAEILIPENIPDFGIVPKLKHPDQCSVATRFVKCATPFNPEALKGREAEFKNLRCLGSIIGFDDLTFFNLLVGQDGKIKAIDGINPVDDNSKRKDCFSLLRRNFCDYRSFFGGCNAGEEEKAEANFSSFMRDNPAMALTVGDLQETLKQIKSKKTEVGNLFEAMRRDPAEATRSYEQYVTENTTQLKYVVSSLQDRGPDYKITERDLLGLMREYTLPPSVSPAPAVGGGKKLASVLSATAGRGL